MDKMALMVQQIKMAQELLAYCAMKPEASINIEIKHDDGHYVKVEAYDHAAFVQGLMDAFDYLLSEL